MTEFSMTRRRFNKFLATGVVMGGLLANPRASGKEADTLAKKAPGKLRVAAIQMVPTLGDVQANLTQAERLVSQAMAKGAEWIMLPEMFTSAAAFHPDLLHSVQPIDGPPAQLMKQLSRKGNAVIGGSFLATREQHVYNSFLLTFPDGTTLRHDKDYPTYWENCFCKGGKDDGVMNTPIGPVGSALCWEIIRSRTAQRLMGKVKLVVGGSCWWTLPDDADPASPLRAVNLKILQESAPRFARLLGVPVIFGSHAGRFHGFYSPNLADVPYDSMYLGEAMIVDASGNVLARRTQDDGEGVIVAEVTLLDDPKPLEPIPERFWIPREMPEPWKESWEHWFDWGAHYYETVTLPFLETGEINEYTPKYML